MLSQWNLAKLTQSTNFIDISVTYKYIDVYVSFCPNIKKFPTSDIK
jgi:hypothetical protein